VQKPTISQIESAYHVASQLMRVSGASRSRPASRKMQRLVSVSSWILNVSSQSRLEQNFECLGLVSVSETWVSGHVSISCTSLSLSRCMTNLIENKRQVCSSRCPVSYLAFAITVKADCKPPIHAKRPFPYSSPVPVNYLCPLTRYVTWRR